MEPPTHLAFLPSFLERKFSMCPPSPLGLLGSDRLVLKVMCDRQVTNILFHYLAVTASCFYDLPHKLAIGFCWVLVNFDVPPCVHELLGRRIG
ncbi:hypothetical protein TNCT_676921 [Trichonephila clavata]|uniref:Uncharacterized protein n=1 Tax=Trichonephila clavata TaxID=2740835 RepID=A0A8X6H925_TRICU|nr:hypothetical protein TNCT_676921 [Trichonephila clavata]